MLLGAEEVGEDIGALPFGYTTLLVENGIKESEDRRHLLARLPLSGGPLGRQE